MIILAIALIWLGGFLTGVAITETINNVEELKAQTVRIKSSDLYPKRESNDDTSTR